MDTSNKVLRSADPSLSRTDKEMRLSLSVINYIDLIHGERCADLLRELHTLFACRIHFHVR